ncbi:MAG: pyruvate kinase, partial [Clostridia bacterium]|nr:pyruvate kinase [Clostridia bacterium]
MRKTKIIGTVGPACDNDDVLRHLFAAGMDVCRLNFSHGTHEDHAERIERIKRIREELDAPIPIMLDTKGPEYRIGEFDGRRVTLKDGQKFTFSTDDFLGDNTRVSVSYKNLINELSVGDTILVNNGLVVCTVDELTETEAICTVECGGVLSNKKSMNFPNHVMHGDFLSDHDKEDLLFGIEHDVDFIAASFVSTKDDVQAMRAFLDQNGGKDIEIIAKIENRAGVDNVAAICDVADGIMVARGDLGVEIPFAEVPAI